MQYAVLIYDTPDATAALSLEEQQAISGEYIAIRQDTHTVDGAHLQPATTATTVRVQDGQALLTDGPFADTKEVFAGFYIVEADDLDTVIDIAARIPAARLGGAVEIRPMVDLHA